MSNAAQLLEEFDALNLLTFAILFGIFHKTGPDGKRLMLSLDEGQAEFGRFIAEHGSVDAACVALRREIASMIPARH